MGGLFHLAHGSNDSIPSKDHGWSQPTKEIILNFVQTIKKHACTNCSSQAEVSCVSYCPLCSREKRCRDYVCGPVCPQESRRHDYVCASFSLIFSPFVGHHFHQTDGWSHAFYDVNLNDGYHDACVCGYHGNCHHAFARFASYALVRSGH